MKFAHISDTHIFNLKYHDEYREVFEQLYEVLKEEKVDYIIHCGDLAHTKTQISPEFVELCSEFLYNLANIAPTYVILGNHDTNIRSNRQDAISPIVWALDHPNLCLLKNSGETHLEHDFVLNHLSIVDEDNWISPTNNDLINIALFHGSIDNCRTDIGWIMERGDYGKSIFDKFDYGFLGDIHKQQSVDSEGRFRWAGSTTQLNHAEDIEKGILIWDIKDKQDFSVKRVTFKNPRPFVTINLTSDGALPEGTNLPEGARVRLIAETNLPLGKVRKVMDSVKFKFDITSVTFLSKSSAALSSKNAINKIQQFNLRDTNIQEKLIEDYLSHHSVEDRTMEKVLELNKRFNIEIEQKETVKRNVRWKLKRFNWDNLFNFGEGNSIDFGKLRGIVGIFGKNFSGKTSIIDSLLYTLFNSPSKNLSKNVDLINEHKQGANGTVTISVGSSDYIIKRNSEKYEKKLKGAKTIEAKTDILFGQRLESGQAKALNGLSRQDTDAAIRRNFGTLEEFMLTSLASQEGSLSFIAERSTRRKEILAKFLDLVIFEEKFKLAQEESRDLKGALKRLEGKNYDFEISKIESLLKEHKFSIQENQNRCGVHKAIVDSLGIDLAATEKLIQTVPSEIIDVHEVDSEIKTIKLRLKALQESRDAWIREIRKARLEKEKTAVFLEEFDINEAFENQETAKKLKRRLLQAKNEKNSHQTKVANIQKRIKLLDNVPCGPEFSHCQFIKDAYAAESKLGSAESTLKIAAQELEDLGADYEASNIKEIEDNIRQYNTLVAQQSALVANIAKLQVKIEKNKASLLQNERKLLDLQTEKKRFEENKEAIEQLSGYLTQKKNLEVKIKAETNKLAQCEADIVSLHKKHGSLEQKRTHFIDQKDELDNLRREYTAYDLFMTCCHPNGIAFDIIKEKLPVINEEITKILANIVDFEIFFESDDKKLNIFIRHPKHEARPIESGSGAERSIASMAIRLALISITSLPVGDVFILDEPATSLDEENMEGFIRTLDMVKSYFKTVILISHLDTLKDCVDQQIIIEKKKGFAHVSR